MILSPTQQRMPGDNKLLRQILETCFGRNIFLISPQRAHGSNGSPAVSYKEVFNTLPAAKGTSEQIS